MGIIGCGAQAVSQLHALSRVHNLQTVLIYDIDFSASYSFKERTDFVGLDVQTAKLQELVSQSDIIITSTSVVKGKGPVFQDGKVKPCLHINAAGSDFKGKFEIPISLLKRSTIVPDFLAQAVVEGECQQLQPQDIGPNIVEIIQNQKEYQSLKEKLSVFDLNFDAAPIIFGVFNEHLHSYLIFECPTS